MKQLILLLCLVAGACDSPTVVPRRFGDIYEFRLLTPDAKVLRWPAGSTVRVYVHPDANATLTGYLERAVEHAAAVWNEAALYGEVKLERTTALTDADAVVQYSVSDSPVNSANCPPSGGLAYTTFCLTQDQDRLTTFPVRDISDSGVKFLLTVRTVSSPTEESVRRLVTHELGHVLGIAGHSPTPNDLMYSGVLQTDRPTVRDRATLQVLYHTLPDIMP